MDLAHLQAVIDRTFGDRDRARGVPATVAWLCEEVGELAQAVRKGTVEQQRHEFADVIAWVATLANQMGTFLQEQGVQEIWFESAWKGEAVLDHLPDVDLLITLGGDGTLLRAARLGAQYGVPMLGVKMGRLGFLAEIMPDDWQGPLSRMLAGDFWVEERLMVRTRLERAPSPGAPLVTVGDFDALNDVVLSRGALARIVRISIELDGGYLTTYTCDGLIVSTATGSTGYALAVDGPILPPELRSILVLPIAPHLSMDRALVLAEETEIRMRAYSDHEAMLTVDGQVVVEVSAGDEVVVTGRPHLARFVRMRDRNYFYQALMEKMRWPDAKEFIR